MNKGKRKMLYSSCLEINSHDIWPLLNAEEGRERGREVEVGEGATGTESLCFIYVVPFNGEKLMCSR